MKHKIEKAFTVIELLTVIGIIALLMGIVLPSLSAAREQTRSVLCRANLKQLGLALRMYGDDCNGNMPSAEPYPGSYGKSAQHWFNNAALLNPLGLEVRIDENGEPVGPGKQRSVLTCPTHKKPDWSRDSLPEDPARERAFALSYMANGTLGVSGKCNQPTEYRQEREFKNPARAMMFCEGNGTESVPGTVLFDGCPKPNLLFRHRGRAHALFLDQHVELRTEEEVPFCSRFDEKRFGEFWYAKKP